MIYSLISILLGLSSFLLLFYVLFLQKKSEKACVMPENYSKILSGVEKSWIVVFGFITVLFLFTRLFYLGVIPKGLHIDEIGMSYDAYSLSHYGMDRYNVHYPVYLRNFGGGQSALYAYLTAFLLRFFSYSTFIIRLPAVIMGFFCYIASFYLIKDIVSDYYAKKETKCPYIHAVALLGPLLVTVTPYFMTSERWALDCNLFLSMATIVLCFVVKALLTGKKSMFFLAGVSSGITLYTYAISYLVMPLFLVLVLIYCLRLKNKKLTFLNSVVFVAPLIILALPLVVFQLVNMGVLEETTILCTEFRKLGIYRIYEISVRDALPKIVYMFKSMLGSDGLSYNGFREFGPVYLCMVPLIIYGAAKAIRDTFRSVKTRECSAIVVVSFFFVSIWCTMLLHGFCFNAVNEVYIAFLVFFVYGLISVAKLFPKCIPVFLSCIAVAFVSFSIYYFVEQNKVYERHDFFFSTKLGEVVAYAEEKYDASSEKELYISFSVPDDDPHNLLTAIYGKLPAKDFDRTSNHIGKFHKELPEKDEIDPNALYIIGSNQQEWIDYLRSQGFSEDASFETEIIFYK